MSSLNINESKANNSDEKSSHLDTGWVIEAGPRNKSLATRHLETIAYAMLDPHSKVAITNNSNHEVLINVNGTEFNFTKIMRASPDFVHLKFDECQLSRFVEIHGGSYTNNDSKLHPAEYIAIRDWTGSSYGSLNLLLRSPVFQNVNRLTLLIACIAAHGLTKPNSSVYPITRCTRKDDYFTGMTERQEGARNKKVVTNRGFSASAHGSYNWNKTITTTITQPDSINPMGKSISHISQHPQEQEVLFPPNTDFKYERLDDDNWVAEPVCPANPPSAEEYHHSFSWAGLSEIEKMKINMRISTLYNYLETRYQNRPSLLPLNTSGQPVTRETFANLIKNMNAIKHNDPGLQGAIDAANEIAEDWNHLILKPRFYHFDEVELKAEQVANQNRFANANQCSLPPLPHHNAVAVANATHNIIETYYALHTQMTKYYNDLNNEYSHSNNWSSKLSAKHTKAQELLGCFVHPTGTLHEKIADLQNFKALLKQPASYAQQSTVEIMGKHRANKLLLILTNLVTSLTIVGLVAQICTGRFTLWKSKGEKVVNRANDELKKLDEVLPIIPPPSA